MRRNLALGLLVAVGVVVVVLLVRPKSSTRISRGHGSVELGERTRLSVATPTRVVPAWFADARAARVWIAGHVRDGADAAPGATVWLSSALTDAGYEPARRIQTDATGRFDFGRLPPARYRLVAAWPGRTNSRLEIDSRNPLLEPAADRIELSLGACDVAVSGTVRDASGGPIVGASVGRDRAGTTRTTADGSYRLCTAEGRWSIVARADGYATESRRLSAYGRPQLDFLLVPSAVAVGKTIRADTDASLAHALVEVFDADAYLLGYAKPLATAVADGAGRFELTGLGPGRYQVLAASAGFRQRTPSEFAVKVGVATDPILCRLEPAAELYGKVVLADATPVAGVALGVSGLRGRWWSQADGSFSIRGLPYGRITVRPQGVGADWKKLRWTLKEPRREVTVVVERRYAIEGRVERDGVPVEGVTVRAVNTAPETYTGGRAPTKKDGRFRLLVQKLGTYKLEGWTASATTDEVTVVVAANSAVEPVSLTLGSDRSASISGTVVDQHGAPLVGALLTFQSVKGQRNTDCATDGSGAFEARGLVGADDYKVWIKPGQDALRYLPPASGSTLPVTRVGLVGAHVCCVRYAVRHERLSVSGRLEAADGSPVADTRVTARPPRRRDDYSGYWKVRSALTSSTGAFEFRNLAAGKIIITVGARWKGQRVSRTVDAGTRDVVLKLSPVGAIAGTLSGFSASPMVRACAKSGDNGCFKTWGQDGRFHFRDVPVGTYAVTANTRDEADKKTVDVTAGAPVSVALTNGGTAQVDGRLEDFRTGAPIPQVSCKWSSDSAYGVREHFAAGVSEQRVTDGQGRFWFRVPAGRKVDIICGGYGSHFVPGKTLELRPGTTERARLRAYVWKKKYRDYKDRLMAWFGLTFAYDSTPATILVVEPWGPAHKAGVRRGDQILAVDGEDLRALDFRYTWAILVDRSVGDTARLRLTRNGREFEVAVTAVNDPNLEKLRKLRKLLSDK